RWLDGIMARVFDHKTLVELAEYAKIPIINGLSDIEHPCQALADYLTLREHKDQFEGLKIAFIGDGNNVANSLALMASNLGVDYVVDCPEGYEADRKLWQSALSYACKTGAKLTIESDPVKAVAGADAIYTDTWTSMGQESEEQERAKAFGNYQVNTALLSRAK